jgi:hypothetical protein
MRNFSKIVLALVVFISLMGFEKNSKIEKPSINKTIVVTDTLTWKLLGDIKYIRKKHASYGEVEFPQVNLKLKSYHNKTIYLTGFIVPIDSKNYALSKNVFASCFFCGKSGPETIAGLKFKGGLPKLKTDTYLTIKGTFKVNETDVDEWIYNIENAEIVSKK